MSDDASPAVLVPFTTSAEVCEGSPDSRYSIIYLSLLILPTADITSSDSFPNIGHALPDTRSSLRGICTHFYARGKPDGFISTAYFNGLYEVLGGIYEQGAGCFIQTQRIPLRPICLAYVRYRVWGVRDVEQVENGLSVVARKLQRRRQNCSSYESFA